MDLPAIRGQIDRILRSQTFASKEQLRKLLGVLSKQMESQAALTPELVIKQIWPDEIRTKRSRDVATEMNRLRRALSSYYGNEGASDPITISLPNRAVGVNGTQERPWIVAHTRAVTENGAAVDQPPAPRINHPRENPRDPLRRIAPIAALLAAVILAAYIFVRVRAVPGQPKFGRLDGSILRIMDAEGKQLWSKSFPDGFATDWYYDKSTGTRIWFGDLEGQGQISVLFSYLAAGQSHSSTLICYSYRGQEKWRWTPGRELPDLAGSPPTFRTVALGILKANDKRPSRIVVSSVHDPW
jgi:hypothetical protein